KSGSKESVLFLCAPKVQDQRIGFHSLLPKSPGQGTTTDFFQITFQCAKNQFPFFAPDSSGSRNEDRFFALDFSGPKNENGFFDPGFTDTTNDNPKKGPSQADRQ
ncbi:MAG: hypothetical protein QNK37_35080, partial [Acidobacteriota bacterium]|nr:hypothetical protein [Acidobacteriota bacterium]